MSKLSPIALHVLFCVNLVTSAVPCYLDEGVESLVQVSVPDDELGMLQVFEIKNITKEYERSHDMHLVKSTRDRTTGGLSHTVLSNTSSTTLSPVTMAVCALMFFASLRIMHSFMQAAFENLPGVSCALLLILLGAFCWAMIPVMWKLDGDMIGHLGIWSSVGSYLAIILLMLSPLMLITPDHSTSKSPAQHVYRMTMQEEVQHNWRIQKFAVLFCIVLVFQITAAIPIFSVLELAGGEGSTPDNAGPIMAIVLYLILAWCGLSLLYERLFPDHSFAVDFPAGILRQAVPSMISTSNWRVRNEQFKSDLEGMKAAIDAVDSPETQAQEVKDIFNSMSTIVTDISNNFMQQTVGLTGYAMTVQGVLDSTRCGFFLHYLVFMAYCLSSFLCWTFLGVMLVRGVWSIEQSRVAMLCALIGISLLIVFLWILLDCVVHGGLRGGFSQQKSFPEPAESRAMITMIDGKAEYLAGLWELQQAIESRIRQHFGRENTLEPEDPVMLASKVDLASTLFKRGDFECAEKLHREVWEARSRILGPEHPDTLTSMENLASDLRWSGDTEGADRFSRAVWEARVRNLGPDHPDTLTSKYRLERGSHWAQQH